MNIFDRLFRSTDTAVEKMRKNSQARLDLDSDLQATVAELAEKEVTVGDELLASKVENVGDASIPVLSRISFLRSRRDGLERALLSSNAAQRTLIPMVNAEKADALEAQAADLERQANEVEALAMPILQKLAEISECDWQPKLFMDPTGTSLRTLPSLTRWECVRSQAAEIRRSAMTLKAQEVCVHGEAEADSVEGLIAIAHRDECRIAPAAFQIRQWAADRIAEDSTRPVPKANQSHRKFVLVFHITWRDGQLVEAGSWARRRYSMDMHTGLDVCEESTAA